MLMQLKRLLRNSHNRYFAKNFAFNNYKSKYINKAMAFISHGFNRYNYFKYYYFFLGPLLVNLP